MIANLASQVIRHVDNASVGLRAALGQTSRKPGAVFLMLHSIGGLDEAAYIPRSGVPSTPVDRFRELLRFFARRGYETLTASQFAARRAAGQIGPRTLVLTFDDGFRDNYSLAAPILAEMGMTATFYPVCGWIGRDRPAWLHRAAYYADRFPAAFTDTVRLVAGDNWARFFRAFRSSGRMIRDAMLLFRQGLRPVKQRHLLERLGTRFGYPPAVRLYMNWREMTDLQQAGMEIGGHTVTHRSLWTLDEIMAWREIVEAKRILEHHLGGPVQSLAYPYGHFLPAHTTMAREAGYTHAVTVRPHHNDEAVGPFELGRYGINSTSNWRHWGRISLRRTESPTARLNWWFGRHLEQTIADPELGLVRLASRGWAYETTPAAIVLQNEDGTR